MLLARIAKKKYNLGGRGGDGRSEVPPGRKTLCCTYCGRGDYVAKRSAAGTRDIVLYRLRTWRNGRRTALRMLWIIIRGGSIPPVRTITPLFSVICSLLSVLCYLFSNKNPCPTFQNFANITI